MDDMNCTYCNTVHRHLDWDFLRDVFNREKSLELKHESEICDLTARLGASQVQLASAEAYRYEAQAQIDSLQTECNDLKTAVDKLNHLHDEKQSRMEHLESCYEATCTALARQSKMLEQKDSELDRAKLMAHQLEQSIESAASTQEERSNIKDASTRLEAILLQNQSQSCEIRRLKVENLRLLRKTSSSEASTLFNMDDLSTLPPLST